MLSDYLRHAECIKERSTAPDFCGPHYNRLVEQVDFIIAIITTIIIIIITIIIIIIITINMWTSLQ